MNASYSGLSRAALSFEYLHTNSTTHEFLFGALAELIDNSKDARSKKIEIYSERNEDLRGGYMLCFLDDGHGMNREEAHHVITFGRSAKKAMDTSVIGQYGNGLKSGSMRVAKDFIVFSKSKDNLICIYMSRTFHEEEKIAEVIVPIPCWDVKSRRPYPSSPEDLERHSLEMQIIFRHSPFKTEADLFAQFDKIESDTGTLVVLVHMKLLDNGEPELDVTSDPTDIVMGSEKGLSHEGLVLERRSLRAYTSIMYLEPVMKIYIQGIKVQTRRLANCLYKPKQFKFTSTRFKTRAENDAREARQHAKVAEEKAREAESKYRDLLKRVGNSANREARSKLNLAKNVSEDYRSEANYETKLADQKEKLLKDPKILHLIFGFNIENRSCDGMFMYNCGRLIKMYDRTGPQLDGKITCNGIVGIVDVPYIVLQPAHNKQDFSDGKEYRHLLKVMGEHLVDYWNDSGIMNTGVNEFWESFGYESGTKKWNDPPSNEPRFVKRRQMNIPQAIQCDMCLKWRLLPTNTSSIGKQYPPNWVCQNNPDAQYNRCNAPEQKFSFPLIDRKKLNKDTSNNSLEDKPAPVVKPTEMPSFGRTILQRPDVLPAMKVFKPSPLPVIAPTKLNEAPKLMNQTPVSTKRASAPDLNSSKMNNKTSKRKSPSPEPPPTPPLRSKSSSRIQQQTVSKDRIASSRKRSPSPPPPKQKQSRRSPSPEQPKRSRRKSPSPVVDKRKSAALLNSQSSTTSKSRKKSPSPEPVNQTNATKSTPSRTAKDNVSKRSALIESDSDSSSERETEPPPSKSKRESATDANSLPSRKASTTESSKSPGMVVAESTATSFEPDIGKEVQVLTNPTSNKWLDATIIEIHSRTKKFKVQFKQKSIPDKWVLRNEIRAPVVDESSSSVKESNSNSNTIKAATSKLKGSGKEKETVLTSTSTDAHKKAPSSSSTTSVAALKDSSSNQEGSSTVTNDVSKKNQLPSTSNDNHVTAVNGVSGSATPVTTSIVNGPHSMTTTSNNDSNSNGATALNYVSNEKLAEYNKIVSNFKLMLKHFTPPDWKETGKIDDLTNEQLACFPLSSFYRCYEEGLRQLLSRQVQKQLEGQKLMIKAENSEFLEFKAAIISFVKKLSKESPDDNASLETWTTFIKESEAVVDRENNTSTPPHAPQLTNGSSDSMEESSAVSF